MHKAIRFTFSAKKLIFGNQCSQIITQTATEIAKVAAITLGPMGRNVAIENGDREPRITKDGVTVVKHIEYVVNKEYRRIAYKMQSAL
jgi:chaperonin GroEL